MCKKSAKDEFIQAETCVEKGKTLVWTATAALIPSPVITYGFICMNLF